MLLSMHVHCRDTATFSLISILVNQNSLFARVFSEPLTGKAMLPLPGKWKSGLFSKLNYSRAPDGHSDMLFFFVFRMRLMLLFMQNHFHFTTTFYLAFIFVNRSKIPATFLASRLNITENHVFFRRPK